MDYVITFSDVMAGVITLGLGVITFFIKGWFNNLKSSTEEIKKQIRENDEKVNKRIDKLEEETDRDIANIKQELNDIKGDFATTFVLREDFFRSMNGVENSIRSIDNKIDKILIVSLELWAPNIAGIKVKKKVSKKKTTKKKSTKKTKSKKSKSKSPAKDSRSTAKGKKAAKKAVKK